ncbi:MAG: nucleotidyl transferase AbiEii/AbiGii toxin family protein, partial [Pseudomonadota bacterium]|nr:nucleotidyl transferase AbiEii/AbiGii toxin family protein [Pseudomonadota bacterium]
MTINLKYKEQVDLLIEVISPVLHDERLALKGGTAINLFTMNMPRFSVDLDVVYLPVTNRDEFISGINSVFQNMAKRLTGYSYELKRTNQGIPKQARIAKNGVDIKVEINLILRGTVYPSKLLKLCQKAKDLFEKSTEAMCV